MKIDASFNEVMHHGTTTKPNLYEIRLHVKGMEKEVKIFWDWLKEITDATEIDI